MAKIDPGVIKAAREAAAAAKAKGALVPGSVIGAELGWRYQVLDGAVAAGQLSRQVAELTSRGYTLCEGLAVAGYDKPVVYRIPQEVYDETEAAEYQDWYADQDVQEYVVQRPKTKMRLRAA